MADRSMKGVYPILSTPFDEQGRIVIEDLEREVDWMIGHGVDGLGIAVASEVYKFTEAERDLVLKTVVARANGRAKIVMNTGAEGTEVAIAYSKRAEELGADALMIRPTSFIPMPTSENIEYFARIAKSVSIPIFLQDQGSAPVPPAMAVACAKRHENLCYVKVETPPTVPRMAETAALAKGSGLILFGGAGGAFVIEEFRRGSVGTMPGSTLPDTFVKVWRLWNEGKEVEADDYFTRYSSLLRTLGQAQGLSNWIYKYVMIKRGVFSKGSVYGRHPSLRPDEAQFREVDRLLEQLDLVGK